MVILGIQTQQSCVYLVRMSRVISLMITKPRHNFAKRPDLNVGHPYVSEPACVVVYGGVSLDASQWGVPAGEMVGHDASEGVAWIDLLVIHQEELREGLGQPSGQSIGLFNLHVG